MKSAVLVISLSLHVQGCHKHFPSDGSFSDLLCSKIIFSSLVNLNLVQNFIIKKEIKQIKNAEAFQIKWVS